MVSFTKHRKLLQNLKNNLKLKSCSAITASDGNLYVNVTHAAKLNQKYLNCRLFTIASSDQLLIMCLRGCSLWTLERTILPWIGAQKERALPYDRNNVVRRLSGRKKTISMESKYN